MPPQLGDPQSSITDAPSGTAVELFARSVVAARISVALALAPAGDNPVEVREGFALTGTLIVWAPPVTVLPKTLPDALAALEASALFCEQFGETFISYFTAFKRTELGRFEKWKSEHGVAGHPADEPTEWEQNEYFDYF